MKSCIIFGTLMPTFITGQIFTVTPIRARGVVLGL